MRFSIEKIQINIHLLVQGFLTTDFNKVWKCFYITAGGLILLTAKYTMTAVCIKYTCITSKNALNMHVSLKMKTT